MNNFTVDNLLTNGMAPAMLAAGSYPSVTRPDIYRPSSPQPIVSQPYPTSATVPQTVFPSPAGVPVEDVYNRSSWYSPQEVGQTSPLDYQQPTRFDNRSPNCVQTASQSFRDAYKAYSYDCNKY